MNKQAMMPGGSSVGMPSSSFSGSQTLPGGLGMPMRMMGGLGFRPMRGTNRVNQVNPPTTHADDKGIAAAAQQANQRADLATQGAQTPMNVPTPPAASGAAGMGMPKMAQAEVDALVGHIKQKLAEHMLKNATITGQPPKSAVGGGATPSTGVVSKPVMPAVAKPATPPKINGPFKQSDDLLGLMALAARVKYALVEQVPPMDLSGVQPSSPLSGPTAPPAAPPAPPPGSMPPAAPDAMGGAAAAMPPAAMTPPADPAAAMQAAGGAGSSMPVTPAATAGAMPPTAPPMAPPGAPAAPPPNAAPGMQQELASLIDTRQQPSSSPESDMRFEKEVMADSKDGFWLLDWLTGSKVAAQDNSVKERTSATGESKGLTFEHRPDDYAKGPEAWDSLSRFMRSKPTIKKGGVGHGHYPFPVKQADLLPGGIGDNKPDSAFNTSSLARGIREEKEHTRRPAVAKEIAKDHLTEDAGAYKKAAGFSAPALTTAKKKKEREQSSFFDRWALPAAAAAGTLGLGSTAIAAGIPRNSVEQAKHFLRTTEQYAYNPDFRQISTVSYPFLAHDTTKQPLFYGLTGGDIVKAIRMTPLAPPDKRLKSWSYPHYDEGRKDPISAYLAFLGEQNTDDLRQSLTQQIAREKNRPSMLSMLHGATGGKASPVEMLKDKWTMGSGWLSNNPVARKAIADFYRDVAGRDISPVPVESFNRGLSQAFSDYARHHKLPAQYGNWSRQQQRTAIHEVDAVLKKTNPKLWTEKQLRDVSAGMMGIAGPSGYTPIIEGLARLRNTTATAAPWLLAGGAGLLGAWLWRRRRQKQREAAADKPV